MKKVVKKDSKRKVIRKLPTINIVIFFVLRLFVVVSMVEQSIRGNWNNVFLCILTLVLFTGPIIVKNKLHIGLPKTLEIIIYLFIFSSAILGEIQNFYGIFKQWDTLLHTLNGFLCAAVGFSLVDILNRREDIDINMTPIFMVVVSISFSMTVGVLWEFIEFGVDTYLNKDMQKDRVINTINSKALGNLEENELIKIEDIDKQMAKLFEMRMECSKEIALYKKENNIPIYDATREKTLIEKNRSYIKNDMFKEYYLEFFKGLLDISKKYQEKLKNN